MYTSAIGIVVLLLIVSLEGVLLLSCFRMRHNTYLTEKRLRYQFMVSSKELDSVTVNSTERRY